MSGLDLKTSACPYEKELKLPADSSSADWGDNSQFELNILIIQCIKCCLCAVPLQYEKEAAELKKKNYSVQLNCRNE